MLSDTDSEIELQEQQEERPVPIPKRKKAKKAPNLRIDAKHQAAEDESEEEKKID